MFAPRLPPLGLSVMRTRPSVTTPSTWGCPAVRKTSTAVPASPPASSSSAAPRRRSGSPRSSRPQSSLRTVRSCSQRVEERLKVLIQACMDNLDICLNMHLSDTVESSSYGAVLWWSCGDTVKNKVKRCLHVYVHPPFLWVDSAPILFLQFRFSSTALKVRVSTNPSKSFS